jgi:hypothetical protein
MDNRKMYDFYFSAEQQRLKDRIKAGHSSIHGFVYTEAAEPGQKPFSKFDDFVLVFAGGNSHDVKFDKLALEFSASRMLESVKGMPGKQEKEGLWNLCIDKKMNDMLKPILEKKGHHEHHLCDVEKLQDDLLKRDNKITELKVLLSDALGVIREYVPGFTVLIESIEREINPPNSQESGG